MTASWHELEHTADLAIRIYGTTLAELFITAAKGMFSLAFDSGTQQVKHQFVISLKAPDVESLLVEWLNELLYLSEKHNAYVYLYEILEITENSMDSRVSACDIKATKQVIKAATYHNIAIKQDKAGLHTDVVFDL